MNADRRSFLRLAGTVGLAATAGCGGDDGQTVQGGTEFVEITDYEWYSGANIEVTVQNKTEDALDLVEVGADLFVGDERVGHASTTIGSLSTETTTTDSLTFVEPDQYPCDADRLELVSNFSYDGTEYEKRYEHEIDAESCQ